MALSSENRAALHAAFIVEIRRFIAGAILTNQRAADRAGLHLTDLQCLNVLELLGPVTPGRLAECTGLSTGGVTVMLDRLERSGFVKREPNPEDRRSVLIRVNGAKARKIHSLYAEISRQMETLLAHTEERDLRTVKEFFVRMNGLRSERGEL